MTDVYVMEEYGIGIISNHVMKSGCNWGVVDNALLS